MNQPTAGGPYRTALVVDDDAFSLEVADVALRRLGLSDIATAEDGQAGIRRFDRMRPKPDLIVCDLFMPDMDGIEFINSLGERRFAGALVMVTGGDLSMMQMATQLAQSAYGLNVRGAIPKPLLPDTLAAVLGLPAPEEDSGA